MKIYFTLLLLAIACTSYSQTFTGTGGNIPDYGPSVYFSINVSGLNPANIDTIYGLEKVCVNITHSYDADLNISLLAPDGSLIDLSSANGGSGDDYTNTCFYGNAGNLITNANPPFTGTFRPEGVLGNVNNGQNANGTWKLKVKDTGPQDIGNVVNWSIKFSNTPSKPPVTFSSSNLPLVLITTNGQTIQDEPKIMADIKIINNSGGQRNYLNDAPEYTGKIGIELRGSSSQGFPKKSYGFETWDNNGNSLDTSLLGKPRESDWILSASYTDKTFMRNYLSYKISRDMDQYASRTKFCEVFLNGQYQGVYVFMEKIKRNNDRVDISKLTAADTTGDELTGGYIIKIDKSTGSGGSDGWTSAFPPINNGNGQTINFFYDYPSSADILSQQKAYIKNYVDSFETALNGSNFANFILGYRNYIDVPSFVDYFIINELSKNIDGYRISTYLHKLKDSKGRKLKMGPVWDYDIAWCNADYYNGANPTGWAYNSTDAGDNWQVPFWWEKLLTDTNFTHDVKCRWLTLRTSVLDQSRLFNLLDSNANVLNEAQERNFEIWPIMGVYVWPNPTPLPQTYQQEVQRVKDFIAQRIAWLDNNLPGNCYNLGMSESSNEFTMELSPNPANNFLNIYIKNNIDNSTLSIYDMQGKIIRTQTLRAGYSNYKIELEDLSSGLYTLRLSNAGVSISRKFVKN